MLMRGETGEQPTASFLEEVWPLRRVRLGAQQKAVAGIRAVRRVETQEGSYVYKVADEWATPEVLRRSTKAFELIREQGFWRIPALLKTRQGGYWAEYCGQYVYMLECVEGSNPEPSALTYEKLGEITAELHEVAGYPYAADFRPGPIIAKDLRTIAEGLSFGADYQELVESLPSFDNLPQALIHTDVGPHNSIERVDGELVLVDWDGVGVGTRVLDVAFPLIQQFISEDCEYNAEWAKAFYGVYRANITMTTEELDHVFPAALFIALMYIIYGNTAKRWKRIGWALANREMLEDSYRS
jgi:Ser/Thr protein kinase RdoA (MazF antagonist)